MVLKKIILHIGLPKAGSSSLQVNYFRHLNDKNHGYGGIWPLGNIGYTNFEMTQEEQDFASLVQPLWKEYSRSCDPKLLHQIANRVNKPIVILSSEFTTSAYHKFCSLSVKERLAQIRDYFSSINIEATFILSVRDSLKMLISQYYDHPFSSYKKNFLRRKKVINLNEWIDEQISYNYEYINTLRVSFFEESKNILYPHEVTLMNLEDSNINWSSWIEKEHLELNLPEALLPNSDYEKANYGVGEKYVKLCQLNSYIPKSKALIKIFSKSVSNLSVTRAHFLDKRNQNINKANLEKLNHIFEGY